MMMVMMMTTIMTMTMIVNDKNSAVDNNNIYVYVFSIDM